MFNYLNFIGGYIVLKIYLSEIVIKGKIVIFFLKCILLYFTETAKSSENRKF